MASEVGKPQKIVVSLDALVAQLNELKGYITSLQAQVDQVLAELRELRSSEDAVSELKTRKPEELLAPADRRGHIMLRVIPSDKEKVVAHVGQNFYAEVPLEKAIGILLEKEKELRSLLGALQKELGKAMQYYKQLESVINAAVAQASAQEGGKG